MTPPSGRSACALALDGSLPPAKERAAPEHAQSASPGLCWGGSLRPSRDCQRWLFKEGGPPKEAGFPAGGSLLCLCRRPCSGPQAVSGLGGREFTGIDWQMPIPPCIQTLGGGREDTVRGVCLCCLCSVKGALKKNKILPCWNAEKQPSLQ